MSTTAQSDVTALYQVKLLAALRNGDPNTIHHILAEISKDKQKATDDEVDIGAAALHLAIRCASTETVALLLSQRSISPNAVYPLGSGTTALHLAASIGRADVVHLLLEQEEIDDTLQDAHGMTCKDVARGKDVQKAIRDSRSLLTASYRSMLHSYIASPPNQGPPQALVNMLHSPRARLVDLSYLDPTSGSSLLHEAARRKDLSLIDACIKAGADVFVRDRRGKSVADTSSGGRDDKVKVFLRQFTNQDTSLLDQGKSNEPPLLRGYLSKWTNVARGYNTRWFVLQNGTLSYYRHQDDEQVASRGSISLKSASLRPPSSSDSSRFEISSTPSRGQQRWYLKGNHHIEVNRWVNAISRGIELARRDAGDTMSVSSETDITRGIKAFGTSIRSSFSSKKDRGSGGSAADSVHTSDERLPADSPKDGDEAEEDDELDDLYPVKMKTEGSTHSDRAPPYEAEFTLHSNSTAAQVEITSQLLSSFKLPEGSSKELAELKVALDESAQASAKMINELVHMSAEREEWWKEELTRERARGAIWEESLQTVVKEGAALEEELKTRARSRRRSSRIDVSTRTSMDMARSTLRMRGMQSGATSPPPFDLQQPPPPRAGPVGTGNLMQTAGPSRDAQAEASLLPLKSPIGEEDVDTDEEDEFFDAIDSNAINVIVPEALISPPPAKADSLIELDQYEGYKHLREHLPIEKDTRPPTSLWSVLKHSIGKDLTKISFPVFFNEPTSMLQRMAEDMEFSECLDAASVETDPHKRIAFVAAFAMSNYSSTIGRIAKPFNPMLSETFEYVRLDKHYRYVSEQVSHHPPISACWAESPSWHYFGEVDAQNKFMGKSFEIRPTGVAHAELLLPESFGPNYPKAKGLEGKGKVIEHYSWKKVTTNVSGFIVGSPTIDHYGDMTVTNHRTGDTCVLTFKPRGWRGKDAYEIFGQVLNANGDVTYEIAGRWNTQLVARQVGTGHGMLHPDVTVQTPASPSLQEYILLWRNTEKPPTPFNLTPFAITLNDLPEETLKPVICPTDCRLRPDQRAFEVGKYERANELKQLQEDFQRATRRAREEGRVASHRPRWFEAKTEPETGERVWEPIRADDGTLAYWKEREAVWKSGPGATWPDVERIFIEDEP